MRLHIHTTYTHHGSVNSVHTITLDEAARGVRRTLGSSYSSPRRREGAFFISTLVLSVMKLARSAWGSSMNRKVSFCASHPWSPICERFPSSSSLSLPHVWISQMHTSTSAYRRSKVVDVFANPLKVLLDRIPLLAGQTLARTRQHHASQHNSARKGEGRLLRETNKRIGGFVRPLLSVYVCVCLDH